MPTSLAVAETPTTEMTEANWLDGLDAMEQAFVLAFVEFPDVRAAARKAGYADSVAMTKAYQWVSKRSCTKPHVKAAIDFELARQADDVIVTKAMVVKRLRDMAFFDPRALGTWRAHRLETEDEVSDPDRPDVVTIREIVSNTVELRDSDELTAAEAAMVKKIHQDKDGNVTIEFHDPTKALGLLSRHLGLITNDVNVKVKHSGTVRVVPISAEMTPAEASDAWRDMIDITPNKPA